MYIVSFCNKGSKYRHSFELPLCIEHDIARIEAILWYANLLPQYKEILDPDSITVRNKNGGRTIKIQVDTKEYMLVFGKKYFTLKSGFVWIQGRFFKDKKSLNLFLEKGKMNAKKSEEGPSPYKITLCYYVLIRKGSPHIKDLSE